LNITAHIRAGVVDIKNGIIVRYFGYVLVPPVGCTELKGLYAVLQCLQVLTSPLKLAQCKLIINKLHDSIVIYL
jgi:hypothetical protein